ncbi:hypothetical protein tinsulaeT_37380 [Thalassotalea insulae]|uniref:Six-hairpin glycosidase-like protein n=1 Tax=Thalassotalea insulae TaxID=2056778 RepID=A0ABQ6GWU6_9GAMM|nr:hypothetical protein [Thalassotalea insulae]GLX80398.1 hypothetical protein tinsulaeT_37380 [Thalassotalea insulae]
MQKKLNAIAILLAAITTPVDAFTANHSLNDLAEQLNDRWSIANTGIQWQVTDSHQDHIEFSGEQVSGIIYYGSDNAGNLVLNRKLVWPMLRTIPNDTHASLIHEFPLDASPSISLNGETIQHEKLIQVNFDGILTLTSRISPDITIVRTLSPSPDKPLIVERISFENNAQQSVEITTSNFNYRYETDDSKSVYGRYAIEAQSQSSGSFTLAKGEQKTIYVNYFATQTGQSRQFNSAEEIRARQQYVTQLQQKLELKTPDPVVNKMFEFAKLRAAESIFRTKGGLMHGPGGGRYYAAIWANDQAEYINPFFPFLGNDNGNESAINSFNHFARFMNDKFEPIPSSIIAEGDDIWNGAGDRGDCAMIAYGASRFALAYGHQAQANALMPLIDWCLAYNKRQLSSQGVIGSDSDELEGRFPAGDYNLSTNMLAYGALVSASYLNKQLGDPAKAKQLHEQATTLLSNIEKYFGAKVQGYDTYRYFDGNTKLRAWISLPLTMGVFTRKQGTLAALLSSHLWNENGIYSEAGNKTFWDRATLYSFRGIFAAQETDTAMRYFKYYSRKRLLGEHVPYAVEAWPEGDQRHLSAESALYARVVTEGIFGIEPTGFNSFKAAPYLPSGWNEMCLNKIQAFNDNFNLCVKRNSNKQESYTVSVYQQSNHQQTFQWQGESPLEISLK